MKNGISIAGNILVDYIKIIDIYPQKNMLANIIKTKQSVGGCVPNTSIDLAKIDKDLPIYVYGKIGLDDAGKFVLEEMQKEGINTKNLKFCDLSTSFTDVMTVKSTGERTFFHNRGANTLFCEEDIDLEKIDCSIFHIGYLLLLDKLDEEDAIYGTKMAKLLNQLQNKGIKTSIDVVSENSDRFNKIVAPSLKYCNYVIINEIEAGKIANIEPRNNNKINIDNIEKIMIKLFEYGVKDKVIVHCPEYGFLMNSDRKFTAEKSLQLPKDYIKGTVGAGDAFCAGSLYGIYNNYDDKKILKFANLTAVSCLSESDSISGVKTKEEILSIKF